MDRRTFIKVCSLAGLSVVAPVVRGEEPLSGKPRRDYAPYDGLFFVMVNAGGGWDPTHLCDPKGAGSPDEVDPINNFLEADIEQAGNIRYAPVGGNAAFFQKHYQRLCVINGIDMKTNGHDAGSRHTWSGRLGEGWPSLSAFLAASFAPEQPMAFLSFGGFDLTAGIVARTRSGNVNALANLAYPERRDPNDPESTFHSQFAIDAISNAHAGRAEALLAGQNLPKIRQAMSTLFTARAGSNELKKLQEYLPENLDQDGFRRQVQVALAAYRAGICVSCNLHLGGFDTHGNHDAQHIPRLQTLLEGLDFLFDEAEAAGVIDRTLVVVGSDFGRTPGYNEQAGKDHWSVTSMMLAGPGIPGNRVIGVTDDGHRPLALDPGSLQPSESGIRIEPKHIHRALRKLAGVSDSELAAMFPLDGEDLPLFS
ncbi:MAG: DUF1501 domain-containing protein [Deltaproteobacteria bacterium]|nr:MAG: DUF1501 domain-containing protein [Deltaproteobacteria bacterium]